PARAQFLEWLGRGARFQPIIHARLRAAGLPEDLYYLALVESGYEPHAVSHAGAVGMWQFMAPTARELGLRVDWWVDERRDPIRSTESAARMLRWMRREFGSTFVAAAAYNGGPGRVQRGLTQLALVADSSTGDSRFFALSENSLLRAETQNYVPQLIAASLVAKDTARFGLVAPRRAPFVYDSVRVPALTPLAAVARAAGASRAELLDLNPQILRGMTPPGASTPLRVPVGAADGFARRLAALDEGERRAFRVGVTRKRETLAGLADRLDATPAMLEAFNGTLETVRKGKLKGRLVAGQQVRVPTDAVRAYARGLSNGEAPGLPALPPAERVPEPPVARGTGVAQGKDREREGTREGTRAGAGRTEREVEAPRTAKEANAAKPPSGDASTEGVKLAAAERGERPARDVEDAKDPKDAKDSSRRASASRTDGPGRRLAAAKGGDGARERSDVPRVALATVAATKRPAAGKGERPPAAREDEATAVDAPTSREPVPTKARREASSAKASSAKASSAKVSADGADEKRVGREGDADEATDAKTRSREARGEAMRRAPKAPASKPATTTSPTTKPATTKPATAKPATAKPATAKPATKQPTTTDDAAPKTAPTKTAAPASRADKRTADERTAPARPKKKSAE
ncbi:MAG TPA: transglycosylase SLT domain-containing protein, partial [Gemmatirosa sp.]|nr:transglycosylase SLT domain-containing protein [Gemmatirosa sp.]